MESLGISWKKSIPRTAIWCHAILPRAKIFDVCVNQHLGINGQNVVYLDVSHIPASVLNAKLEGVLDIYQKFVGDDPRKVPMRVAPSVHYSMGGLWVGLDQQTNIPGLFAAGECDYTQHGANRLGANSLLSAVFAGMTAGPNAAAYAKGLPEGQNIPQSVYEAATAKDESDYRSILKLDGAENAYRLHQEMGELMTKNVTVVRNNADLAETLVKLEEIDERLSPPYRRSRQSNLEQRKCAVHSSALWHG